MTTKFRPPLGREIPSPSGGGKARVFRGRNGVWRWSHGCNPDGTGWVASGAYDSQPEAFVAGLAHAKRCCR